MEPKLSVEQSEHIKKVILEYWPKDDDGNFLCRYDGNDLCYHISTELTVESGEEEIVCMALDDLDQWLAQKLDLDWCSYVSGDTLQTFVRFEGSLKWIRWRPVKLIQQAVMVLERVRELDDAAIRQTFINEVHRQMPHNPDGKWSSIGLVWFLVEADWPEIICRAAEVMWKHQLVKKKN